MADFFSKITKYVNNVKFFISTNFFGYGSEIAENFSYMFKRKEIPVTKFMIFSSGRSGSTLLISLLHSHPDVCCDSEILKHKKLFPLKTVRMRTNTCGSNAYGFKFLGYQLKNVHTGITEKKKFIEQLHSLGYKIIYLERQNRLNQALSNMYAFHSNQWHLTNKDPDKDFKLKIDMSELKNWLDELELNNQFEKEMLEDIPYLYLSYEDDLANAEMHDKTIDKITKYIGVKSFKAKTNLRKVVPLSFDEYIVNANEMRKFLEPTLYGKYLPSVEVKKERRRSQV